MEPELASRWRRVAEGSRHGRVHVEQLHALGLSKGAVDKAVASGRLDREHPGVPVVSVARVLVELSRIVDGDELQRALREAQYQRLFVLDEVEAGAAPAAEPAPRVVRARWPC